MRRILIPVVVLAAALALGGCSSSGSSASRAAVPAPKSAIGNSTSDSAGAKPASDLVQREVITTAHVTIRSTNPVAAGDRAAHIAESAGGRVDDRSQTAATSRETATASLTLRIPADRVTSTLDRLKALGKETSITMSADDVTTQGQDLDAKIKALTTSVDRLLALEAKAKNSETLISFETAISDRQGQLDSLTSQRRYLSDQVAMSTISLRIEAPTKAVVLQAPSPANAVGAGFSGFTTFFTWVFLVLSYLLPWIILAAVVTVVWVGLVRWTRRRRAGRPDAAAAVAPEPPVG